MHGAIALRKLEALADADELNRVLTDLNWGAREGQLVDPTSCAATATAVVKTLTNQPIPKSVMASSLAGGTPLVRRGQSNVQTDEIMRHIDRNCLVMLSLTFKKGTAGGGDHHFAVFKLDTNTVVAAMGWQNKYTLTQWYEENEQGVFKRTKFQSLMADVENGSCVAVAELCSFLGSTKDGRSIPEAVEQEVNGYRAESTGMVFQLPGS